MSKEETEQTIVTILLAGASTLFYYKVMIPLFSFMLSRTTIAIITIIAFLVGLGAYTTARNIMRHYEKKR